MRMTGKLIGLTLLLYPVGAAADPITIASDLRRSAVLARVTVGEQTDRHTAIGEPPSDAMTTSASAAIGSSTAQAATTLFSSVADPAHMWGRSSSSVSFDTAQVGDTSAYSEFTVAFHLDSPTAYVFNGTLTGSGEHTNQATFGSSSGRWTAVLGSGTSTWFNEEGAASSVLARIGLLFAGDYVLHIESDAVAIAFGASADSASSGFDFRFDLAPADISPAPTPEPASLVMLGSGLLGLVGAARRRRAAVS